MRIKQTEVYLKACVTSQFLVFFTPHVALTFFIFCGVQKDIKKKNPPRFLGHHGVSLKYLKYPAIVYSPPIAWIDVLNLHFLFGCVGCLHVLPSLHLKLNREVLRH